MNKYRAFYKDQCADVIADTASDAQVKATKIFKVTVIYLGEARKES